VPASVVIGHWRQHRVAVNAGQRGFFGLVPGSAASGRGAGVRHVVQLGRRTGAADAGRQAPDPPPWVWTVNPGEVVPENDSARPVSPRRIPPGVRLRGGWFRGIRSGRWWPLPVHVGLASIQRFQYGK